MCVGWTAARPPRLEDVSFEDPRRAFWQGRCSVIQGEFLVCSTSHFFDFTSRFARSCFYGDAEESDYEVGTHIKLFELYFAFFICLIINDIDFILFFLPDKQH